MSGSDKFLRNRSSDDSLSPPPRDSAGDPEIAFPKPGNTVGYEDASWRWNDLSASPDSAQHVRGTPHVATPHEADTVLASSVSPTGLSQALSVSSQDVSLAPTMSADSQQVAPAPVAHESSPFRSLSRSTVLPRVELVGDEPKLVRDEKPRYEQIVRLGEGGMGEVDKALDNDIGRTVAVKRLKTSLQGAPILVRFVGEIRTIGQLEHPNIVPIHDVGLDERGDLYFVMKYVAGETLETIIERLAAGDPSTHAAYPFERRVAVFEGILEAIHYAHAQGIIHRDLKPANVMVGSYGEVVVMDWGIAKRIRGAEPAPPSVDASPGLPKTRSSGSKTTEAFQTLVGSLIGTPAYMSPEQARGEPVDERSDIYSLCVLFHELLCLRHYLADQPTTDAVIQGVIRQPAPLAGMVRSKYQSSTPMDLAWFAKRGLNKDPAQRYQSVAEMIERLQLRRQGKIPIQCHITFLKRMSNEWTRLMDRHPMAITVAMACAIILLIGLGVRSLR